MKILVTGAGGFLGSRIVASLLEAGHAVRAQVRQGKGQLSTASVSAAGFELVAGNLLSRPDCARLTQGVDMIIHAAAGTRGAAADMYMNSVVATRNLLESMDRSVRRVCLVSSFAVYDTNILASGDMLDEASPTESVGVEKGPYALSKVKQEELFLQYQKRLGFEYAIVRPGVIYGPGGSAMSSRVGINALGFFFRLGGRCLIPLSYVDNCADAVVRAALDGVPGGIYNAVDDDLPTCAQFLRQYRRHVKNTRTIPVPYFALALGVRFLVWYSRRSKGQIPAVLTPYIVRSMYRKVRYTNDALRKIGWKQRVSTAEGVRLSFDSARKQLASV